LFQKEKNNPGRHSKNWNPKRKRNTKAKHIVKFHRFVFWL